MSELWVRTDVWWWTVCTTTLGLGTSGCASSCPRPGPRPEYFTPTRVWNQTMGPISPRGRPVLRPHEVHGAQWHLWQTFTDAAVDVRLDSDSVLEEIDQHLRLLRANRVWGVRLDAVAYFQKYPGCEIRHNPGVYEIADSIAALVERHGIRVFAQLDCDSDGLQYFGKPTQSHYVVNDFSYSAYLTLAVVSGDAQPLARHLSATAKTPRVYVSERPRTHDGILLRSGLLNTHDRDRLIDAVGSHGVPVRMSGSSPYEINGISAVSLRARRSAPATRRCYRTRGGCDGHDAWVGLSLSSITPRSRSRRQRGWRCLRPSVCKQSVGTCISA